MNILSWDISGWAIVLWKIFDHPVKHIYFQGSSKGGSATLPFIKIAAIKYTKTPRKTVFIMPIVMEIARENMVARTPAAPLIAQNQALFPSPKRIIPVGKAKPIKNPDDKVRSTENITLTAKAQPIVDTNNDAKIMLTKAITKGSRGDIICILLSLIFVAVKEPVPAPKSREASTIVVE